jgi:transmembrane sensor
VIDRSNDKSRQAISEEAMRWLTDGREADPDENELLAWLKQSPIHVEEFLLASSTWTALDAVGPHDDVGLEHIIAAAKAATRPSNVHDFPSDSASTVLQPQKAIQGHARPLLQIAAALVLCVGAAWLFWLQPGIGHTYSTSVGEQRSIRLRDGSVLQLNTDSRVQVRFAEKERSVQLIHGEALFNVAHDASRPFRVMSGDSVIQAIGTQFDVYRQPTTTTVSVIEGIVQISRNAANRLDAPPAPLTLVNATAEHPMPTPTRVSAGEQAVIDAGGKISTHPEADVSSVAAWRERRLVFRGETLAEIALEFNRYTERRIQVEGEAARNLRLAGTFDADDPESLISFLKGYDNLIVQADGSGFTIRSE